MNYNASRNAVPVSMQTSSNLSRVFLSPHFRPRLNKMKSSTFVKGFGRRKSGGQTVTFSKERDEGTRNAKFTVECKAKSGIKSPVQTVETQESTEGEVSCNRCAGITVDTSKKLSMNKKSFDNDPVNLDLEDENLDIRINVVREVPCQT